MAGRPPSLFSVASKFLAEISSIETMYRLIQNVPRTGPWSNNQSAIHPRQAQKLTSFLFAALVASLDRYIEESLVRYRCGAPYPSREKPTLTVPPAASIAAAYRDISGMPTFDRKKHYLKVSPYSEAEKLARSFMVHGKPYSALDADWKARINDAYEIRHRVAHNSAKSRAAFKSVALRLTGRTSLHKNYSVGNLLLEEPRVSFGKTAGASIFERYVSLFCSLIPVITPFSSSASRH